LCDLKVTDAPQFFTPQFVPAKYRIGQDGVYVIDNKADDRMVLDIALWCSEKNNMSATFEWTTRLGRHYKSIIPLATLTNSKETCKWLARRGVVGFDITRKGMKAVKDFMFACVKDFSDGTVDIRKAALQTLSNLAIGFINHYSQHVAELRIDQGCWTVPYVEQLLCLGRVQHESAIGYSFFPRWSLAVKPKAFTDYAATLGFGRREVRWLLRISEVKNRQLLLCSDHIATAHVWVIPLLEPNYVQRGTASLPYGLARWTNRDAARKEQSAGSK
jgi:hypothetical protein